MSQVELERLWFYTEQDVVPEDFELNTKELYVFRLPRAMFRKGARTFNDIADDLWSQGMYDWFLFFCEFVQRLRYTLASISGSQLLLFLEVVEGELALTSSSGTPHRSHIYHHPSQFGCVEDLLQSQTHSERLDMFLPDIPEVPVAEYRFWLAVSGLDVLGALRGMMEEVESRRNSVLSRPSMPLYAQLRQQESPQIWQEWLNLNSVESITYWIDNYRCKLLFSNPENMARAKLTDANSGALPAATTRPHPTLPAPAPDTEPDASTPASAITQGQTREHPLHPINFWNHVHVFREQFDDNPVAETQRLMNEYIMSSGADHVKFHFPKRKNVLCLSPALLKPELIYNKYLPDFQKSMIVVDDMPLDSAAGGRRQKRAIVPKVHTEAGEDYARQLSLLGVCEEVRQEGEAIVCFNPQVLAGMKQSARPRVEAVQSLSSLEQIRLLSQADLPIIHKRRKKSMHDYRDQYRAHQDWVFDEFSASVLQNRAVLSDVAKRMVKEIIDTDLLDQKRTLYLCDVTLDIFGNMVASRLEAYDKLLFVYATHRQFLLLQLGSYDAFRHCYSLHYNAMLIGQSNTSKSYALDLMEACAVDGSIQAFSYQTLKADASDGDNDDAVTVMNEFSLKSVSEGDRGGNGDVTTQEALIKEKATSMKMRAKILRITADGTRETVFTFSSCIGCFFGASNDDPSQVSESFASRFHWDMFQAVDRPNCSIVDLEDADKRLPALDQERVREFRNWMRQMQCLHWLVEKLIMTGGLTDVSLTATNFIVTAVNNYLMAHNLHVHNRIFKRIKIQARLFTIHLALHYLYFVPLKLLSPEQQLVDNFYGKPFELEQLKYIDLYLRDEEAIAYFVLGLMREQIVNPIEDVVRKCLRELHDQKKSEYQRYLCVGSTLKFVSEKPGDQATQDEEVDEGKEDLEQQKRLSDSSSNNTEKGTKTPFDALKEAQKSDAAHAKVDLGSSSFLSRATKTSYSTAKSGKSEKKKREEEEAERNRVYNYSYLRMGLPKDNIAKHIRDHYTSVSKPSLFQIKAAWEKLCSAQNLMHTYKMHPEGESHFPVRDDSVPKSMQPLVHVEHGEAYVHADVLCTSSFGQDVLMEAIENTFHRYTQSRKIVFGEQYDYAHPNLFRTLQLTPSAKTFTTRNVLYMNKRSKSMLFGSSNTEEEGEGEELNIRKIPVFFLDEDLDTRSCGERLSLLGIVPDKHRIAAIHPRTLMKLLLRAIPSTELDRKERYPESFLTAERELAAEVDKNLEEQDLQKVEENMPAALSSKSRLVSIPDYETLLQQASPLEGLEGILEELEEEDQNMIVEEPTPPAPAPRPKRKCIAPPRKAKRSKRSSPKVTTLPMFLPSPISCQ